MLQVVRTHRTRLSEALTSNFTVYRYDRRGRGESGDTQPYAVTREIEDLEAVIAEAGGSACVLGISSGAGLAIEAAASGVPIEKLALFWAPNTADGGDTEQRAAGRRPIWTCSSRQAAAVVPR